MKILAFVLLAAGALSVSSRGQSSDAATALAAPVAPGSETPNPLEKMWEARREGAKRSKWDICVDLVMVAVEQGKALDLIPDLESGEQEKVDMAWGRVQAMIKTKEAMLLAWPMVRTVDGSRAVSESITEKRYATEYEEPLPPKVEDLAAATAEKPLVEDALPAGFETRNVGVTLEVDPTVLDDGKRVHVELAPKRVELLEMEKSDSRMNEGRTVVREMQPLFGVSSVTESLTVASDKYQLVGVHVLTKPEGWIELHLVRVRWAVAK
ncbi:hypothetical protein CfE428DRAFT_5602 [Chthoniobacter flavus Ellin428]|uniref:Uncharacterized protein n=1 Tax=Chthoniobacter flavus Ellin428 TaxID=497964 RepID=B4D9L2_9BACT|nr:hypothetical protein [Chthoniobacter flavus]EDY16793.1 hypothetical protein CfE428DRAFT_5602 [Chthoniobacter flavus Ellin428]TCO93382.1 hypothetical protein EV701_10486 [Chthoniobacter flavus]